ncbi:YrzI family small protein [Bacillus sp. 165]|nr:YrzI family small protein [Bacillus sp. 165]MBO9128611.1 YrzI family small protein [Bacillus sp. 165]
MKFTVLFFTITIQKRHMSKADIDHNVNRKKLMDEVLDRQCSLYLPL